ncbi:hypothetical protein PT2222_230151 [Paraburkholderia tropica]
MPARNGRSRAGYGCRADSDGTVAENRGALDLGNIEQDQRDPDDAVKQHEAARADLEQVEQRAEQDRQQKAAQPARQSDDAGHDAHVGRKIVGDIFEGGRHAEREHRAEHEGERHETCERHADMERGGAVDGVDHEVGGRVREDEETDPRDPQAPPGDVVRAEFVGKQAADRAQHRARQRETRRERRRHHERHAVFGLQILRNPQRERGEAAERDRVILAQAPDARIGEHLERVEQRAVRLARARIARRGEPEDRGGHEQRDGVDARHEAPSVQRLQGGRDEQVDGGARRARAEEAHREAAFLGREEARDIRRADRERRAHAAEKEADEQKLPELARITDDIDRHRADHEQDRHDDAPAVAVGPRAQRQTHDRAGQHGRGREQAELGAVELELFAQRHAEHAEHHPHDEADQKGERAREQNGPCLPAHAWGSGGGRGRFGAQIHDVFPGRAWCGWGMGGLLHERTRRRLDGGVFERRRRCEDRDVLLNRLVTHAFGEKACDVVGGGFECDRLAGHAPVDTHEVEAEARAHEARQQTEFGTVEQRLLEFGHGVAARELAEAAAHGTRRAVRQFARARLERVRFAQQRVERVFGLMAQQRERHALRHGEQNMARIDDLVAHELRGVLRVIAAAIVGRRLGHAQFAGEQRVECGVVEGGVGVDQREFDGALAQQFAHDQRAARRQRRVRVVGVMAAFLFDRRGGDFHVIHARGLRVVERVRIGVHGLVSWRSRGIGSAFAHELIRTQQIGHRGQPAPDMHHPRERRDEEDREAERDMHLIDERHAVEQRREIALERHHAFHVIGELFEHRAVHVMCGQHDGHEPERELHPQHQHDDDVPHLAVAANARVAQTPRDQQREPDDGERARDAARDHREQLVHRRGDERRDEPVRREKAREMTGHHDENAPVKQVAAKPQRAASQELRRVAFPRVLLAVEAHQRAEQQDREADVRVDAEQELMEILAHD